ncbi:PAS domain S-box protein [Patescibacteria group bacterium]|nr:PAS domain S-box protein [Patescibacteria group bacterium]
MAVSQLNIIAHEYLIYREKRMEQQWHLRYDSAAKILAAAETKEGLIELIYADYTVLGDLFSQVTANYGKIQKLIQEGAAQEKIDTVIHIEERLVAQLLIESQSIIIDASRFDEKAMAELLKAQELAKNLTLLLAPILIVFILITTLTISRIILKSLSKLTKGVEIIGKGNFEHKIDIKSKDEIGKLATAFNEMTGKLRKSYNDLEKEITERQRLVEKLRIEDRAIASSLSAIAIIDPEGSINYVNPAFLKMWGYDDNKEVLGKPAIEFWRMKEKAAEVLKTLQKKRIWFGELTAQRKDAISFEAQVSASIITDKAGRSQGNIISFVDITERKQAEEKIQRLNRELDHRIIGLKAVNKELGAFSYSVSHDLQAPLRAINGFSQILLEDYSDKLDKEGKRLLNVIQRDIDKMEQLIKDLLSFSRQGCQEIKKSKVNMENLAKDVFKELKGITPERNLQLKITTLPAAYADNAMIREVLVNLISNAIKFTKYQKVALIEVGGREEGDRNSYYVKDNGVGFDMQYVSKLFGIFQRLHNQREFEGTGVGLAIVQRIIHRHGGHVRAEGKVNEGATFYFTLPKQGGIII